jgi:hypothetical protein
MRQNTAPALERSPTPLRQDISYFQIPAFAKSLKDACLLGGISKKRHDKVMKVLGSLGQINPFIGLSVTSNGEARIKSCVKYDLGDGWRLVTQQANKTCVFLFMGDHQETDRWLEGHKGETFGVQNNRLVRVPGVGIEINQRIKNIIEFKGQTLAELLDPDLIDYTLNEVPSSVANKFWRLNVNVTANEIETLLKGIVDQGKVDLIRNVFSLLRIGNVDGARSHIDLRKGGIAPISDFDFGQMIDVQDGNEVRQIRVGSPEYEAWLKQFEKGSHGVTC